MANNKNQHYIPQYYLKNFSRNGNIHIYDLKNKIFFENTIKSTAYKKFFYNVDLNFFNKILIEKVTEKDFIDKIINKFNENILAKFFDSFNPTRERIINNDNRDTIAIIDMHSLVDFILVQFYRNPKLSLFFKEVDKILKLKKTEANKEYDKIARGIFLLFVISQLHYGKEIEFISEVKEDFHEYIEMISIFKALLDDSYKVVYFNKTKINFLTNDLAMALSRTADDKANLFSTVFVPINTKVGIMLTNKISNNPDTSNNIIQEIDDIEIINQLNLSLIENANRFVYSFDGNFPEQIDKIEYKHWWNIN